jgi:hypothetical protein
MSSVIIMVKFHHMFVHLPTILEKTLIQITHALKIKFIYVINALMKIIINVSQRHMTEFVR